MVPKLRFAEFSGSWIKDKISSFIKDGFIIGHLDGNHGALYPRSEEFSQNGVPYISATDFSSGEVDFNSCKYLPISRANQFKKGIAKSGDVLFAHNATVGPVSLLNTNHDFVILSTTATYFRCDTNKLNNVFLKNSLEGEHFVKQYSSIMSQSTRNQVPITAQRDLIISVPNIREQNKIAYFLSAVDDKITLLKKQYDLLCHYKKGMMQKIFSQEVRFKDENGKDFPQWRLKKIREITSLIKDGTHGTHNNVTESDFLLLSAKNIQEGKVVVDSKDRKISEIEFRAIVKNYKLAPGDILLSVVGTIGRVAIYSEQYANYAFQRSVAFFRFPQEQPEFIYQLFNSTKFQKELIIRQVISAQPGIYLGDLADISLEIPVQKEQMKIANFLSALDDKIAAKKAELDRLKTWKQGLYQQMFV